MMGTANVARDTRPHRILFLDHAPIIGGGQLSLAEHVRLLDRTRFQPLVACTAAAPALLALYRDAGAEVHVIPLPRLRRVHPLVLPQLVRSVRALRRLVRELDVDIVVASTSRAAYIATLGLTRANVPIVWWVRDFLYNRLVFRLLSPRATRIICVSEAVRAFYRGENDPRFAVIVVGSTLYRALAGLDDRDVQAERTRWGFSRDDVVVGFMGRLVEEKGPEDVIAAVADLHQRDPRVKVLIVGSGTGQLNSVEERARELVARRGWSFVTFAGFQSDEALYYRLFDVVVLASREHEGYGMSAVQAMMARTPVVPPPSAALPNWCGIGKLGCSSRRRRPRGSPRPSPSYAMTAPCASVWWRPPSPRS